MKTAIAIVVLLGATSVDALDRIEATPRSVSMSGRISGATDFQFGVHVRGTRDQKIEQLERELRLLRYARDSFPELSIEISYSGTNLPIDRCIADLSEKIGKSVPLKFGADSFMATEFVFQDRPLVDVLKYLAAFGDAILDVDDDKLVFRPVRQALALHEQQYDLLHLMKHQRFDEAATVLATDTVKVENVTDQDGQNLLHFAARRNRTAIAERLIALGVDINAKDDTSCTPLHTAARFGNKECAGLLLKNGADVTVANSNNDTILETAIYFGFLDLAKVLADHGAKLDIFTASGMGKVEKVKELLNKGVDYRAELKDYVDRHVAHGPVIVTRSTDPMRKSPGSYFGVYGVTPLHWAARGGSVEVARLLLSRGESVSATDSNGQTPLFWAAAESRVEVIKFLIEHGADVNCRTTSGATPLLTAARMAVSPELVEAFVEAGADINARDNRGENALHKLAWYGYPDKNIQTARILLGAGADITVRNKDGKTPLDVLLDNSLRNEELVRLYQRHARAASSGRE